MKITIYELLGLIKDGKAPKIIKDGEYIYTLREQFNDYWNEESYLLVNGFDDYENTIDFLNSKIEILDEEDEFEDIREITQECFDHWTQSKKINALIRNQKKIIEVLNDNNKDNR